jgi:phage shock protein E
MKPGTAALLVALAPALAFSAPVEVGAEYVHGALTAKPKAVVVDTRTAQEFEQGHIPGAINIPPERMKAEASRLPRDRSAPVIFYCRGVG